MAKTEKHRSVSYKKAQTKTIVHSVKIQTLVDHKRRRENCGNNTDINECHATQCTPSSVLLLHLTLYCQTGKNIIRSQCMGNGQYHRQHYITYHDYKYSLPSVARFIWQSGDYHLFLPPEVSGEQGSERVKVCFS